MIRLVYFLSFYFILAASISYAQQTVGLFSNQIEAYNGYTLFTSNSYTNTYLINNCGELINEWQSDYLPVLNADLNEEGHLIRSIKVTTPNAQGQTGRGIEIRDWNNNLLWSYLYASDAGNLHHDIEPLPNGNILLLVADRRSLSEAIALGRDDQFFNMNVIGDKIVEIQPIGTDSAIIVWEWSVWDHLVQNHDSTKPNFGSPIAHPERIDLNYSYDIDGNLIDENDWTHANYIDYNSSLDQIVISLRNFNEFWVIDHSTTLLEAASSSGGNAGKGGDILYRWGNPHAYGIGDFTDRKLFGQHGVSWIESGAPDQGKFILFNNGTGRPEGAYSSIEIINPPLDQNGNYIKELNLPFGPISSDFTYIANDPESLYSGKFSNAQQQPNGNILICSGSLGHFTEVNESNAIVWEYQNPISSTGPIAQGDPLNNSHAVFSVQRYPINFAGFIGKDLSSGQVLELNPLATNCQIYENETKTQSINWRPAIYFKNIVDRQLIIQNPTQLKLDWTLFNSNGKLLYYKKSYQAILEVPMNSYAPGLYFLSITDGKNHKIFKLIHVD